MSATLAVCRNLVRGFTGRLDSAQVSDSYINSRINEFYQVDFPARIQLQEDFQPFTMVLQPGESSIDLPENFIEFEPDLMCDNRYLKFYSTTQDFYRAYKTPFSTFLKGPFDGVMTQTTMTLPFPILEGTLLIISSKETFRDLGAGQLQSNLGGNGTYDANTRLVTLNFATAPAKSEYVRFAYQIVNPGFPQACCLDNGKLIIRPVPQTSCVFSGHWYLRFSPLVNDTDSLLYPEWLRYIAYGASAKIFEENGELDQSKNIVMFLEREKCLAMSRSTDQIINGTTNRSF